MTTAVYKYITVVVDIVFTVYKHCMENTVGHNVTLKQYA